MADAKATGFLVDTQIRDALADGDLIDRGTWHEDQIRHASYALRLGEEVQICRAVDGSLAPIKQFTILKVSAKAPLILQPGDTARLYSREYLRLPNNVLAFTVARGLLFVEALCPENTYVDPGFVGTLYTTITNMSNRTVTLPFETQIARIFFFRLNTTVEMAYRPGSTLNIDQQLESVPCVPVNTAHVYSEVTDEQLIESISKLPLVGPHLQELMTRIIYRTNLYTMRISLFAILWPVCIYIIANVDAIPKDVWSQVIANTIAGLVLAGIATLAKYLPIRGAK